MVSKRDSKIEDSQSYEYDKNGNRTYEDVNGNTKSYTYDGLLRLKRVNENNGTKFTEYDFDSYNNISKTYELTGNDVNTSSYGYDKNNRLVSFDTPKGFENYEYDNQGD